MLKYQRNEVHYNEERNFFFNNNSFDVYYGFGRLWRRYTE